jgi:hypothetical protein
MVFVVSVVYCQVEVSATGWLLVQRRPNDCGASNECDLETSKTRRPWLTLGRSVAKESELFKFPPPHEPISSVILMATLGTANETHKSLVTSKTLFKTFSYVYVTGYNTMAIFYTQITYFHHFNGVSFLPPDRLTRTSGQDNQQRRTRGLTKISRHGNSVLIIKPTRCNNFSNLFLE